MGAFKLPSFPLSTALKYNNENNHIDTGFHDSSVSNLLCRFLTLKYWRYELYDFVSKISNYYSVTVSVLNLFFRDTCYTETWGFNLYTGLCEYFHSHLI
jgi:hypothetical protein